MRSTDTFDVFCPRCNILVSARVIAEGVGTARMETRELCDLPYVDSHRELYYTALCGRCGDPFLIFEARFDTGDFSTPTSTRTLFPSDTRAQLRSLPDGVSEAMEQATRAFAVGLYEP